MQTKNRNQWLALALAVGLAPLAEAEAPIHVGLELRHYNIVPELVSDEGNVVEIFLTVRDGPEKKLFVEATGPFGGSQETALSSRRHQVRIFKNLGDDYLLEVENRKLVLKKQSLKYDRKVGTLVPDGTPWIVLQTVALSTDNVTFDPVVTVTAKGLYHRPLGLEPQRLHGEDVWALQRFLEMQHDSVGGIDGWFGPKSAEAVRKYQADHDLPVDGAVSAELWNAISGIPPELFRGDWGD